MRKSRTIKLLGINEITMANNIFEAFIKGADNEKEAQLILNTACDLAVFTVLATAGFYAYFLIIGNTGSLGALIDDPTIPATLAVIAVCAFFTYKGSVIATAILLLNQLLDALVLILNADSSISILSIAKMYEV